MNFLELNINNLEKTILKLFVNEYFNIDELSLTMNLSEQEIINILSKFEDILNTCSITDIYIK